MNGPSEKDVEKAIIEILTRYREGLTFEELRGILEESGYYLNGLVLRRAVSNLILSNTVCKTPLKEKKKFLLILCKVNG